MPRQGEKIGELLRETVQKSKTSFDSLMRQSGLTASQANVLFLVLDNGHTKVTQKFITDHTGLAHPTVIGILKRLETKGFVVTYPDADDRRCKIVEATEGAKELRSLLKSQQRKLDSAFTVGLTDDDQAKLAEYLRQINRNLDSIGGGIASE